jgi:rhomboid family GlyGly-CTERM serine protease
VTGRPPTLTLTLAALALFVYAVPALGEVLVYDRAAILSGEVWRLLTGNWVHFSSNHLVYDLLAFTLAGCIIEGQGQRGLGLLCLVSTTVIGVGLLALEPEMQRYGGLSGVAFAVIVYLALGGLGEKGSWRRMCWTALSLVIGKIAWEMATGRALFVAPTNDNAAVVPLSHALGAVSALLVRVGLRPSATASP